jgi:UPF0755 protein
MRKIFALILIIGMVAVGFLYTNYSSAIKYALNPSGTDRIIVDIQSGSSGQEIAELLHEKGLISNVSAFNFYLKKNQLSNKLQAGRMIFQENFRLPEVVEVLMEGKSVEVPVTLLEGWTAQQIAEHLEEEALTTADAFVDCLETCTFDYNFIPEGYLEGYLYPDTYFVNTINYSDEAFIDRLINTLKNKLSSEDWAAVNASEHDFEDIMIMASIVEREERNDAEKATVAGILWNRFDNGVGLGADATVLYALGRTSGGLTYQDLQVDSPYNTRKYAGLPPTPICNPSIESIRAALYPEDTDYWYYLHDSDGVIHYAETLDGHNANKAKYL